MSETLCLPSLYSARRRGRFRMLSLHHQYFWLGKKYDCHLKRHPCYLLMLYSKSIKKQKTMSWNSSGGAPLSCTKLQFHACLHGNKFNRIIYNFPHYGLKGAEDSSRMIKCIIQKSIKRQKTSWNSSVWALLSYMKWMRHNCNFMLI
ncbi:hypothetical protein KSP40_PGU000520 [Platanthera guangdongensis]|uniref:Maturase K n=1 Tax=Platanthera guangdongensis TaxID=2320717 RepID=A0ABR2LUW9_9ASPA